MQACIISHGAYIPKYRIKAEEIARIWSSPEMPKALNILSKSVPALDEDTIKFILGIVNKNKRSD